MTLYRQITFDYMVSLAHISAHGLLAVSWVYT
jgi:hypothetical protein